MNKRHTSVLQFGSHPLCMSLSNSFAEGGSLFVFLFQFFIHHEFSLPLICNPIVYFLFTSPPLDSLMFFIFGLPE